MKRSFVFRPALTSALLSSGVLAFALGFVSPSQAQEEPSAATATAVQPEGAAPARTSTVPPPAAAEAAAPTVTRAVQAPTAQVPTAQVPTAQNALVEAAPAATLQGSPTAQVEHAGHEGHVHADVAHGDHVGHEGHGHGAPTSAPAAHVVHEGHSHGDSSFGHGAHGKHTGQYDAEGSVSHGSDHGAHGGHHDPHFSDINWVHGLLGEKEGAAPSLLWRPPGTPVPLAAVVLNSAILFFLLIKLGGPKILAALADRKKRVASGIEAAAAMKAEAEGQLAFYEEKLQKLDQEIENIRTQMREQAEAERRRILAEAKSEREQVERDARLLVSQELKLARQELFHEAIAEAVRTAEETIKKQVSDADQQRLADDFLATVDAALRSPGRTSVESRS